MKASNSCNSTTKKKLYFWFQYLSVGAGGMYCTQVLRHPASIYRAVKEKAAPVVNQSAGLDLSTPSLLLWCRRPSAYPLPTTPTDNNASVTLGHREIFKPKHFFYVTPSLSSYLDNSSSSIDYIISYFLETNNFPAQTYYISTGFY